MPMINCKTHIKLNCSKDCLMSTIADTIFKINKHKIIHPNCYFIKQRQCKTGKTIRRRF